jgi:SAM-dependent methyltransferase
MPPLQEHPCRAEPSRDELLERSAPLARALADALCRTPNGNDDCGALHGVWPDLRLLQLAAEPQRHADFYADALGARIALGDASRALISGCADWGMLATTAAAYRNRGAALAATVIDRCPTPLLLCAWYGAEIDLPVRTAVADACLFAEHGSFDVIATHSLLTYRALDGRRQLVANWARLLRPGGAVVTVTRLDVGTAPPAEPAPERAQRFGELVVQRLGELGIVRDGAQLRARAERFALAQVSHPVGGDADVQALFEAQGFDVVRLDVRQLEGMLGSREPVRGAARSGTYAEIVAVKR